VHRYRAVILVLLAAVAVGCTHHPTAPGTIGGQAPGQYASKVPDPYNSKLPDPFRGYPATHAAIVIDLVDCDIDPENCGRDLVLRPVGETESQLFAQVAAFMRTKVGWKRQAHPSASVTKYGQVYNGPTGYSGTDYGGYLSSAANELQVWRGEHYTGGQQPPDRVAIATQAAMSATPDGIYVEVLGSTCGSVEHCQGG
jgi:hypothetical protein